MYLDNQILVEFLKIFTRELGTVICDYTTGYTKSCDHIFYGEPLSSFSCCFNNWLSFYLFCKCVNHDEKEFEAPRCSWKRSQNVQFFGCKRPRKGYGLQSLCRLMYLSTIKLTLYALRHELFYIMKGSWPVVSMLEGFTDQCSVGMMCSTDSSMNVGQQLNVIRLIYASHQHSVRSSFIQGTFDQSVWFGFSSYTISFYIIFRNNAMLKIIVDRRHSISTVIVLYNLWSIHVLMIDLYDLQWDIYVVGMLDYQG